MQQSFGKKKKANGKPIKPSGNDLMESDDPQKVAYDTSVTTNTATLAEIQALIDA